MEELLDTIMEEREDYMVSLNGDGEPKLRTAHFLKPTVTSIDEPVFKLPSHSLSSATSISKPEKLPLKVAFNGWRNPLQNWESWVDRLLPKHESTWKKAGVYEAIMASTYRIRRDNDLVLGFAEKWCSETNTFFFHWGEATISLEDVMILGGYSVLGDSVLIPLETEKLKEIEENLIAARLRIGRTKAKKASQHSWMKYFMEDEKEFEQEAFLSLWLSRFVFPISFDAIRKHVFPIAIHLARGTRIALAPAVLASIYRDLSLLKAAIVASSSTKFRNSALALTLWAPLQFVQIWAWERFVTLSPNPDLIKQEKPRLSQWHMKHLSKDVGLDLNSLGKCFLWRPYTSTVRNWSFPKWYGEMEEWVTVDLDLDKEFESFARCLRVSVLVGFDCIEMYHPHRVAMQFGMDQDLPGLVARGNENAESAWISYSRPISDANLYIPSRHFVSDVTSRYAKWWKKSVLSQSRLKTSTILQDGLNKKKRAHDASVPPGFPPKYSKVERINFVEEDDPTLGEMLHSPKLIRVDMEDSIKKNKRAMGKTLNFSKKQISVDKPGDGKCLSGAQFKIGSSSSTSSDNEVVGELESRMKAGDKIRDNENSMVGFDDLKSLKRLLESSKEFKGDNYAYVPPSFAPNFNSVDVKNSIKEMLEFSEEQNDVDKAGDGRCLSDAQSKSPSSLTAGNGVVRNTESSMKQGDEITYIKVSSGGSDCDMKDRNEGETRSPVQIRNRNKYEEQSSDHEEHEIPGLELEARINKLEKILAGLKAKRESRFNRWMT